MTPIGFLHVEAVAFESRVRGHLPDFDVAAHRLLTGKLGPCSGPIGRTEDCNVDALPSSVASMIVSIRTEKDAVTFGFKEGTRRALLYAPLRPAKPVGPYQPIAPAWFLCRR